MKKITLANCLPINSLPIIALSIITLLSAMVSYNAQAFGVTGHRVTGAIAEQHLSQKAREQIQALLGVESLAQASTWPDEMRSSQEEFWQKTSPPWHYVTIPDGKTYQEVGAPEQGDAYTALALFRKELMAPSSSKAVKQRALRFIVHIIGDLHQPLHVGNGTDRGGNDHKVEFYWEQSNLHRVWDTGLINNEELSYTEMTHWLSKEITPQNIQQWSSTNPLVWMQESQDIRMNIYPEMNASISYNYRFEHIDTLKDRLKMAGVRIASYLNDIYQ